MFGVGLLRLRIIDPSPGGGGGMFALDDRCCICRFIVAASGIPGVGVAPGFAGFPSVLGSGIPGVGVAPLGTAFTAFPGAGIPGVVFVDGGSGLGASPAGILFVFVTTLTFEFEPLKFEELLFDSIEDPHPDSQIPVIPKNPSKYLFI